MWLCGYLADTVGDFPWEMCIFVSHFAVILECWKDEFQAFAGVLLEVAIQGSLNYQFWRDQAIQTYGNFEGFPL